MSKRVLVSLITGDNYYQKEQAEAARRAGQSARVETQIVFAQGLAQQQVSDIYSNCVHLDTPARPDAVVVETVSGDGLPSLAEKVTKLGVGWVLLNRHVQYIDKLRTASHGVPIFSVGTDQVMVGVIQATQARKFLKEGQGAILYITGPQDTSAAEERKRGFMNELVQLLATGAVTTYEYVGRWTEESGLQAFNSWARIHRAARVQLNAIVCQNDDMASGVCRAIQQMDDPQWREALGRAPIFGCDGCDLGRRMIQARQMAATVITPTNTDEAISRLASFWEKNHLPPLEIILKPRPYPVE